MNWHLLAAEADQIQDFVYRSAQLRGVVGGSQLLSLFCDEAPGSLGVRPDDVIVNDGGSFRIRFPAKEQAVEFGRQIATMYRLDCCDGVLTVGEPSDPYDDTDAASFAAANRQATDSLRRAKHRGDPPGSVPQAPMLAFCASCGVSLAHTYASPFPEIGTETNYLCAACQMKAAERRYLTGPLLDAFAARVMELPESGEPGHLACTSEIEEIAALDSRRYVAYLAADGNGMGRWFGSCKSDKVLSDLSARLRCGLLTSLAAPCPDLLKRTSDEPGRRKAGVLPVMPLILGGDDCFALIPAPWCLDFARRFCATFDAEMTQAVQKLDLNGPGPPTISAAVVICKASYPHRLARRRAESLLAAAKRRAKRALPHQSIVHFEVVTNNSLPANTSDPRQVREITRRPCSLAEIERLLDFRKSLKILPSKRYSQLRALFGDVPDKPEERKKDWDPQLEWLLERIKKTHEQAHVVLQQALRELGRGDAGPPAHWDRGAGSLVHGLPDLIEAWRYLLRLDVPLASYREDR